MEPTARRGRWKTLLAFAIIYLVWGSTFLAIRIGVSEVPPFLLAAIRFLIAGLLLYGWMIAQGERSPTARQWMSAFLLAILIFVLDYGVLFWAEQRVPSGAALGEFRQFHPSTVSGAAWLSLIYLIVAGSIVAFTAYVWLIHHESPTRVGTYAYVNPVVAVVLGYFLGGERLGLRTILGTLFVLISVLVITTMPAKKPVAALPVEDSAEV